MSQKSREQQPVLILGAGVNGAALARELLLNGVAVRIVDAFDIAGGATAKSSRLIHGGLRYLEYGDFRLVRESLDERSRLRKLAPQFVKPLRLSIPMRKRAGGMIASAVKFFGLNRTELLQRLPIPFRHSGERGVWLVRVGLWLYDRFVDDPDFPDHAVHPVSDPGSPQVNGHEYRWVCNYTDAQMLYPERFVIALLEDARQIAAERNLEFQIDTNRYVSLAGNVAQVRDAASGDITETFEPRAIVNATGAWGDRTLADLGVESPRLFGGTKGSHFITSHRGLRTALGAGGVYAEHDDGRLVFVLPFGEAVLVGTTDERFDDSPENATATETEIEYLLELVNDLFPVAELGRRDVDMHYSGVRPLPHNPQGKAAAISRDHRVEVHEGTAIPAFTLVGGKLTTARAFGELAAETVCKQLGLEFTSATQDRIIPGGEAFPNSDVAITATQEKLSQKFTVSIDQIQRVWLMYGTRTEAVLGESGDQRDSLAGTAIPKCVVRWVIENEWVRNLDDLVERRLMLLYEPQLTKTTLRELAEMLVAADRLNANNMEAAVSATVDRLQSSYGKSVN